MGFSQALSGLKAAATNLDVIGNNIANSQTVGFKSSRTIFSDIYAGTQAGLGAQVADIQQDFGTGTLENTGRNLDIAISGTGFLRLLDTSGQVVYSRNGQLHLSDEGYLLNASNARLTGYPALKDQNGEYMVDANGDQLPINGGTPDAILIPPGAMPAKATTRVAAQFNLDSRMPVIPATTTFDADDPNTYSYTNNVAVYDSLGNAHNSTLYFVKSDVNTWDVYMTREGVAPSVPAAGAMVGQLVFDQNGKLDATATDIDNPITFDLTTANINGANDIVLATGIDFTGTTQFGEDFSLDSLNQDGYAAGSLVDIAIDQDGNVVGSYSNEKSRILGAIALVNFRSPEGLKSVGDNAWVESTESGQPLLGMAGTGLFGSVESGLVEASNVDLTRELINLIIAQRNYQANSQTIKVQDEVLQNAVNL
jgi:flagellar hook protein FlgE